MTRTRRSPAVELGAGKGYLTQALTDCVRADGVVLVDTGSFRLKADRNLRTRVSVTRVRANILDFDPLRLESLGGVRREKEREEERKKGEGEEKGRGKEEKGEKEREEGEKKKGERKGSRMTEGIASNSMEVTHLERAPKEWAGMGKHLCGAGTDLALRCCLRARCRGSHHSGEGDGGNGEGNGVEAGQRVGTDIEAGNGEGEGTGEGEGERGRGQGGGGVGVRDRGEIIASGDRGGKSEPSDHVTLPHMGGCRGLAVAPCCHHRCSWRHFCGKEILREWGLDRGDFEVRCGGHLKEWGSNEMDFEVRC